MFLIKKSCALLPLVVHLSIVHSLKYVGNESNVWHQSNVREAELKSFTFAALFATKSVASEPLSVRQEAERQPRLSEMT